MVKFKREHPFFVQTNVAFYLTTHTTHYHPHLPIPEAHCFCFYPTFRTFFFLSSTKALASVGNNTNTLHIFFRIAQIQERFFFYVGVRAAIFSLHTVSAREEGQTTARKGFPFLLCKRCCRRSCFTPTNDVFFTFFLPSDQFSFQQKKCAMVVFLLCKQWNPKKK